MLMLKNLFKLAKNTINKNLIAFTVFLKKISKLFSYYRIFSFETTLFLIVLLNYCSVKKQSGKKDSI